MGKIMFTVVFSFSRSEVYPGIPIKVLIVLPVESSGVLFADLIDIARLTSSLSLSTSSKETRTHPAGDRMQV